MSKRGASYLTRLCDADQGIIVQNAGGESRAPTTCPHHQISRGARSPFYRTVTASQRRTFPLVFLFPVIMGCAISSLGAKAEFGERSADEEDAAAAVVYPREDQIQMIKDSWKVIRDDIAKVGIIMFVR